MQALSEKEAIEVIKKDLQSDPFEFLDYTAERVDGGWVFNTSDRREYIVSDNQKILKPLQIGERSTDDLIKMMLATKSPYINPEGMQLNTDYLGGYDAGANLESYDQSDETVKRVLHTLDLRENSKMKAIDEEYILKDPKVYVDHVSDSYTLALKTYEALLECNANGDYNNASKYFIQLFSILEYIKLFRSESVWSSEMVSKIDNISLLYRYEDSLTEDVALTSFFNDKHQPINLTTLPAYQSFKTRFEKLNDMYLG